MKLGQLLLPVLVDYLVTSVSGASDRATRPQNRPTALRASGKPIHEKRVQVAALLEENVSSVAHVMSMATAVAPEEEREPEMLKVVAKLENETAGNDEDPRTAAELTGVKSNEHGHASTSGITCLINMSIVLICMLTFSVLRRRYPLMYSGNVYFSKIAPLVPATTIQRRQTWVGSMGHSWVGEGEPNETFLGWLTASFGVSTEMAAESVGLDAALLVEFCNLACKILAIIGIPMVCIMCPLHFFFGGEGAGLHELRSIAMGNVIISHPWLYYLHAVIVNLVTVLVIHLVYASMPSFLILRYKWLKQMPAPRCVTVLVEGIPEGWRSDKKLKEFFSIMFKPEYVLDCTVVKNDPNLLRLYDEQGKYKDLLKDYKDKWQAANYAQEERPMMRETMCVGKEIDAIDYIEKKLAELNPLVEQTRLAALKEAEFESGGITCSSGFVTFSRRREAEVCHNIMAFSSRRDEWVVSVPPPASDVRWNDLKQPESKNKVWSAVGYCCILMLFIFFVPIVVLGTNLSSAVYIGGVFQPIWDSFAPGLALMLFLAFLPTILLLIFSSCFALKSETFAQHKLQIWYFLFMVFFVILVTVVGRSLFQTFAHVAQHPALAVELLGKEMPAATQFYMDFLMLQWGEQSLNFLRWVPLAKFLIFKTFYEEEDAKRMAEPEDQDFYGIGSRSARFTISLLIGIIFSTLSPLIAIVALILFGIMRVYYGYLVVFAEIKKPDLGGVFYNTQLRHLILGVGVYNVLMISVLGFRAKTGVPMLITVPSLVYSVLSYLHFSHNFVWRELPFIEVCNHPEELTAEDNGLRYVQPEFAHPDEPSKLLSLITGLNTWRRNK